MRASPALPGVWSLAGRQQTILLWSLTAVALLLGVGGAWYIQDFAERTSDRVLRASANAVSETVAFERGEVTLEVPPGAFGMLEDSERDNVYYAVSSGQKSITGYEDFPRPHRTPAPDETLYRYDTYRGQAVRVASQARYLIGGSPPVLVQVAETLQERRALFRRMLLGLVALEGALVAIAALLIGPAVRWGLAPLTRLRAAIAMRNAGSETFEPIDPRQAPLEMQGLIETLNSLLDRLDRASRRVREFASDASHQMRTPLAALRAQIHLAAQPADDATRQRSLADADAAAGRMQQLLSQLLALARSESLVPQGVRSPIELQPVIAEIARELAPRAVSRGLEIHLYAENNVVAAIDPLVLTEIVSNLIDNAVRYGREGGTIEIHLREQDDRAIVEVEDDGPGIPALEREAVFQRFYRLARDQDEEGSGLGLAIVQSLSETAGGILDLADSRSGGLLVRLSLPLPRAVRKVGESIAT